MKRFGRGILLYAIVPYLLVGAGLTVFQRRLLYPGQFETTKSAPRPASDGRVHAIAVKTPDGLSLSGLLLLGQGHSASGVQGYADGDKRRPVVLYMPGNAGHRFHRSAECRAFTDLGVDVVLVDYRGYGGNAGKPTEENLALDALAAWRYVTSELRVASDRVLLFGESLGGGVATRLAEELCRAGTPPAALILSATFSSMTETVAGQYPYFPVRLLLRDRFPSTKRIRSVTCPIAIIHGAEDELIPIHLARKLFDAAPERSQSGVMKEFLGVAGAGHETLPVEVLQSVTQRILRRG